MFAQSREAVKGFMTVLTTWLLLGVNSLVLPEMGTEDKGFPTHVTGTRLLTAVSLLVLPLICLLSKGFPTCATCVRLLTSVSPKVKSKA